MTNNSNTDQRADGYPSAEKKNEILNIAAAWLAMENNPEDQKAINRFGEVTNTLLRRATPDGLFSGIMACREPDVRQEAYLMLERFLRNNRKLHEAKRNGNTREMGRQVTAAVIAAAYIAKLRLVRAVSHQASISQHLEENINTPEYAVHPWVVCETIDMAPDARRQLVKAAIEDAIERRLIDPTDATIVEEMMNHSLTQAQIARHRNISRGRVCQRTKRAVNVLKRLINETEVPSWKAM